MLGAGLINLLIVGTTVWFAGYRIAPKWPRFDSDLRRLMLIALPGIAIAGAGHINVVVAAQLSSGTPSAVSWLYFAERIFQLPLGFVAAAVGVVLLPAVSRHLASGEVAAARQAESRALEFGLLITLPAAIALSLLAKPIVSILYERGAFTAEDSNAVAAVLRALALGLPAFVLVKVLLPAFLAREDMKGPLIAAVLGITANIVIALALFPSFGSVAPAMGVTASAVVNASTLYVMLVAKGRFRPDKLARRRVPMVILTSVLTGVCIWLLQELARPYLKSGQPFSLRVLALGSICIASVAIHLALAHFLKAADFLQIRDALKK